MSSSSSLAQSWSSSSPLKPYHSINCQLNHTHECSLSNRKLQPKPFKIDVDQLCRVTHRLWDEGAVTFSNDDELEEKRKHELFIATVDSIIPVAAGPSSASYRFRMAKTSGASDKPVYGAPTASWLAKQSFRRPGYPTGPSSFQAAQNDGTDAKPGKPFGAEGATNADTNKTRRRKIVVRRPAIHSEQKDASVPAEAKVETVPGADGQVLLQQGNSENDELLRLLRKEHHARTPRDIKRMYRFLRKMKDLSSLSEFVLSQLCGVVHLHEYEANRVVFRQGEVGTSWYIIVSGSVNVLVSAPGKTEDSIVVATKVAGEGFGELALVNDAPRAASILTACPCVLLRVEKVDYNRILRFVHNKEQKEKVFFLRKVPIFVHFTYGNLTAIANVMTMRTYSVGSYVITEGTPINKMHFVKSGKCEILKTLRLSNGATVQVPLGTLENGEYIGEAGVLCDGTGAVISPYSVRCVQAGSDGCVELGELQVHDARTKLRKDLVMTWYSMVDDEAVKQRHNELVDQRNWMIYKRRTIDALVRERYRDPNMNQKKFLAEWAKEKT